MPRSSPRTGAASIGEFLDLCRQRGDLAIIDAEVDADQEIAEIHRRVIAARGPALLFTRVKGSPYPVATNLFGTNDRVDLAFGGRPGEFVKGLVHLAETALPPTPKAFWDSRSVILQGLKVGLKTRSSGPVSQVNEEPQLERLPLLKLWPEDGGHFMTLPLVFTRSPRDGKPNLGMYRIQRYNNRETGLHWQIHKGGGYHYAEAEARNEPLPVTIFTGGPPALIVSAIAPLPEGIPEILLASLLLGNRLPVVRPKNWPHPIPAECEFAFLGKVAPHRRQDEGPFGDHYGYYSLKHPYPVFECERIMRRQNPIWPATVVGKPRQEDFFIGDYLQELLSPLFPLVMPTVKSLWSYGETGFHSLAAAVVRDRYAREAMVSAFRILGEGQLSLTKFLLVTDGDIDLRDFRATLVHILERVRWETDLFVFSNLSMDTLDYTGPMVNKGSKGVILGLGEAIRQLPGEFAGSLPQGVRSARVFCPGCLVVDGDGFTSDKDLPTRVAEHGDFAPWPLVVLCDDARKAAASDINFLWTTFTRFEPAADMHARSRRIVRNHIAFEGPVVIDARLKPWYPDIVRCREDIAETVTKRWKEYFPGGRVAMGSSELGDLTE